MRKTLYRYDVRARKKVSTLGKPPVLTRSGLTYGLFFETFDFATSSTLVTSVVGVVAAAAVVVSVSAVELAAGSVAGWGVGADSRDGDED